MSKTLKQTLPDYLFLLSISGTLFAFDQLSKWLVRTNLGYSEFWAPWDWLLPYVRIVNWRNTGAAFGIFQEAGLIFTLLAILVSLAILNYYPFVPQSDRTLRLALAFQLAGATGNLADRLTLGYVVDFVSVGALPVFNIADLSIATGVLIMLIPYLPEFAQEVTRSGLKQRAAEINRRRRAAGLALNGRPSSKAEEPFSLGMLELLLAESAWMQRFKIRQQVRRIRRRLIGASMRSAAGGYQNRTNRPET